jgi:hypothetical protein
MPSGRQVGIGILFLAVAGLIGAGIGPLFGHSAPGEVPASAMVLLMVALTLINPSLVYSKDDGQQLSAMRLAVLVIVGVFTLLTVKASWLTATKATDLKLDNSWVWIVIAALGGKAAQSFSESFGGSAGKQMVATTAPVEAGTPAQTKTDSTTGPSHRPKQA